MLTLNQDVAPCSVLSWFTKSQCVHFLADEPSEDEIEHAGLLLAHGILQRGDDFGGFPVQPRSLVGTSKITMMASKKNIVPEMAVMPMKKTDQEWLQTRARYLDRQEELLRQKHEDCAQMLVEVEAKLAAVQDINEDSLLLKMKSPARANEIMVQLEENLRSVYSSLNQALTPLMMRRMPSPHLPPAEIAPLECDRTTFQRFLATMKAQVASIAAMLEARSALFRQRLQEIQSSESPPAPITQQTTAENVEMLDLSSHDSTFYVRTTSSKAVDQVLRSLRRLDGKLDVLQACPASPTECALEVCADHRPLMPAIFQQMSKTSLFCPDQDNIDFLYQLEQYLQPVFVPAGNTLIVAGTVGESMFFVQGGACQVSVDGVVRGERKHGEFLGEIALLNAPERSADVRVTEDAELMELPRSSFDLVIEAFPHVRQRIEGIGEDRRRRLERDHPRPADVAVELERVDEWSSLLPLDSAEHAHWEPQTASLVAMLSALQHAVRKRTVGSDERVMGAGQPPSGVQVLCRGSCYVHESDSRIHTAQRATVFGLGPLLFSGKAGFEVTAGPEGAELLYVDERRMFDYFKGEPAAVKLLKRLVQAQATSHASDVWYCV